MPPSILYSSTAVGAWVGARAQRSNGINLSIILGVSGVVQQICAGRQTGVVHCSSWTSQWWSCIQLQLHGRGSCIQLQLHGRGGRAYCSCMDEGICRDDETGVLGRPHGAVLVGATYRKRPAGSCRRVAVVQHQYRTVVQININIAQWSLSQERTVFFTERKRNAGTDWTKWFLAIIYTKSILPPSTGTILPIPSEPGGPTGAGRTLSQNSTTPPAM